MGLTSKIDIHSHILPGLDDGSSSMKESMQMLELARKQGVVGVFATTHYSKAFPNRNPEKILRACRELSLREKRRAEKEDGEKKQRIHIWPGQEVFYSEGVIELLQDKKILTLAGSDYVLTEFLPGVSYATIERAVGELTRVGYRPVIAHAERYQTLRDSDSKVEELIDQGAYIQLNYRSISGKWHDPTSKWCKKLLKKEQVHLLGTDMHNMKTRKPEIDDAAAWMEKHLKRSYIREIYHYNAKSIIENKRI